MFSNTTNSKKQGSVGIAAAIFYFSKCNHTVLLPITDSQSYDLVVDLESSLCRVEVKTTNTKTPSGCYVACLKSSGGSKGFQYGTVKESRADLLFILTGSGDQYLIPVTEDLPSSSITLGPKYEEYKLM